MAIALSGGPNINATFVAATKQNIIDGIETQLLAAGWSTVSGHGTTNLLMQTATTAGTGQGLNGRFRFRDAGTCVGVSCESTNGSRVQPYDVNNGGFLLPGTAKTFRVIACPYQFFVCTPYAWAGREFVCGGVPYVPSNLQGIIWEAVWMSSNSWADTNGSAYNSFRTALWHVGNWQAICNGQMSGRANMGTGNVYAGELGLTVPAAGLLNTQNGSYPLVCHRFHNDDVLVGDPLIYWGLTGNQDEPKIRGQLWDALVVAQYLTGDMIYPINGHDMWVITHQNWGGSTNPRGALVVAIN